MGDLADALFTGFASGRELPIGIEDILLAVERPHGAHHVRFDSVHTLPLVERLSLHEQVLNINQLRLIPINFRRLVNTPEIMVLIPVTCKFLFEK